MVGRHGTGNGSGITPKRVSYRHRMANVFLTRRSRPIPLRKAPFRPHELRRRDRHNHFHFSAVREKRIPRTFANRRLNNLGLSYLSAAARTEITEPNEACFN